MKKILSIITCITLILAIGFAFTACKPDNGGQGATPDHIHDYTPSIKEATCTEDGTKTFTCECGDSYKQTLTAKGHSFDGGVCTVCGADEFPETEYTVYFKNNEAWENVSVYIWLTEGEETTYLTEVWPGSAMTKVDDLWYSYTLKVGNPAGVKLIFNNGLAEGASQTNDLIFSTTNLWWANGIAYASKAAAEDAKPAEIVVYYRNTQGWTTPYAHAWNSSGAINAWPGEAMTKVEGTEDWYSYTIKTASTESLGYMFTDGVSDSNNKTADIVYNAEKLYYSNGNSYATKAEAEADAGTKYSDLYLRGSLNGWGTDDRLLLDDNGNSYITIELAAGDQFKICDVSWNNAIDYTNSVVTANANFTAGTDNNNIKVAVAGTYTFTVDAEGTLTIVKG